MARNGVDVGEDAAKIVPAGSDRLIVQRRIMRRHRLCRREAALQGACVAMRPYMMCR